jgi:hypothetical protein
MIPDTPDNRKKCGLASDSIPLTTKVAEVVAEPAIEQHSKAAPVFISEINRAEMQRFLQQLTLKAYSASTIRTYRLEFAQLLNVLGERDVRSLQPQHLQRYLLHCMKNGLKENSVHSRLNALKFYFEQVLHREKFFYPVGLKNINNVLLRICFVK